MDLRIVVVDHRAGAAQHLCALLGLVGVEAVATHSASEALRLGAELRPHGVLTEIDMPDSPGAELVYRLRQRWPALFISVVTDSDRAADREQAFSAGVDAVLTKPVDVRTLARLMSRVAARFAYGRFVEETQRLRGARTVGGGHGVILAPRDGRGVTVVRG